MNDLKNYNLTIVNEYIIRKLVYDFCNFLNKKQLFKNHAETTDPTMKRIGPYLALVGSIFSILSGYLVFYNPGSNDARFGMAILAGFAILFLVYCVFQEYRFSRKARYSEILNYLYHIFENCLSGGVISLDKEQIKSGAQHICDELAHAFSLITATRCSVCVKVIDDTSEGGKLSPSVSTLCRDHLSLHRSPNNSQVLKFLTGWIKTLIF